MKRIFSLLLLTLSFIFLNAQTWTGTSSSDWNIAGNWNPAIIPGGANNVIIPGNVASGNWPKFSGNVTINSIDLQPGSQLDVNGFSLTLNGSSSDIRFIGTILNNSTVSTDIVINLNTGTGGFYTFFSSNTINDNIVFNITGNNQFVEGFNGVSNQYNGDASFNINDVLITLISYLVPSQYNGNLSIFRTVAGGTSLFNAGANIAGNFVYNNQVGTGTGFGGTTNKTTIGGTIFISMNFVTPGGFEMYQLHNKTDGGMIAVQNSLGFIVKNDTLAVKSFSITGYRGSQYGDLFFNKIKGNVTISDDVSYSGGFITRIRNNEISGNTIFSIYGPNSFIDADMPATGNHYEGDLTLNAFGGPVYLAYNAPLFCAGNLTVNRTKAGGTLLFNAGASITGNFSYSNLIGTGTGIGNPNNLTTIGGKIDIAVNYTSPGGFEMYQIKNQLTGGSIDIQNSQGFILKNDTLIVNTLNISGYKTGQYGDMFSNRITGNVTISDDVSYGGGFITRVRNNEINGNTIFSIYGSNTFIEADMAGTGNTYNGNATFNAAGGPVYIAFNAALQCSGNLTINRTLAGHTQAFTSGGSIGGNFTYTNLSEGTTLFGNETTPTNIAGRIEITATNTAPGIFHLIGFNNQTGGGSMSVQNPGGVNIRNNNILVNECSLTGYKGATNNFYLGNNISGNLTIADDPGYSGGFYTYLRSNIINGNAIISNNGTNVLVDADIAGSGSKFMGNLILIRNGSALYFGFAEFSEVMGNLSLQSNDGIVLSKLKFSGADQVQIDQAGSQAITIANLIMEKTGMGNVTLFDPVSISSNATFNSGQIFASSGKEFVFLDNATCSGGSEQSFIDGPSEKVGNEAFTFPVGKLNKYAPISISSPIHATDAFRAEYFISNPNNNGYDATQKDPTLHHISATEYWMLNRIAGNTNIVVTLSWDASRSGGVGNLNNLRVAHWNGSLWKDAGKGAITGTLSAGTIQSSGEITSFSPFTLASTTVMNPLPVYLLNFSGSVFNNKVTLTWTTENEMDISYYELDKSANGSNFYTFSSVSPKGGSLQNKYVVLDNMPVPGFNYYRLKLVSQDGKVTYSNIVKVDCSTDISFSVIPNPARDFIVIKGAETYRQIRITDGAGKTVRILNSSDYNRFNVSDLEKGIYFIVLADKNQSKTIKLVKE